MSADVWNTFSLTTDAFIVSFYWDRCVFFLPSGISCIFFVLLISISFCTPRVFPLTVLITSGTLSPLDMYPKILNFYPVTVQSFAMSMPKHRECVLPLVCLVECWAGNGALQCCAVLGGLTSVRSRVVRHRWFDKCNCTICDVV